MSEILSNSVASGLVNSISGVATTLQVQSATGFPGSGNFRVLVDDELMIVTAVSGTTFTVTRGAEGTTATAHAANASVTSVLTVGGIEAYFVGIEGIQAVVADTAPTLGGNLTLNGFSVGPATPTDFSCLHGVTSSIQTQLNARALTSSLATVATTGAYSDLTGKPSLATVATTGAYSDLSGKPTLGTAAAQNSTAFVAAGAALLVANNLSDLGNASTARTNLGLTSSATTANASANTASTLVARDSSGNFAAGTITASLTGAASLNVLTSAVGAANGVAGLDSGVHVPAAQIPVPTTSTLGGIQAAASATSHQWVSYVDTSGVQHFSQPAFTDISGTASNAQIPAPTTGALGGLKALSGATSHQWVSYIDTNGVQQLSQPAFSDISGSVAASQLPNPSSSTLGGVQSAAAQTHKFLTSISTSGARALAQPAAADVSGLAASATTDTTNFANISGVIPGASLVRQINAQTGTSHTLVLGDAGFMVTLSNASAITLTVPANSSVAFPVGTEIDLAQIGAGQVTVAAAGGVTINSVSGNLKLSAQYAGATLKKLGTNTWLLVGSLSA